MGSLNVLRTTGGCNQKISCVKEWRRTKSLDDLTKVSVGERCNLLKLGGICFIERIRKGTCISVVL